jgi:hypothetical protein
MFQFTYYFQLHYDPSADSASNRNKYHESSGRIERSELKSVDKKKFSYI